MEQLKDLGVREGYVRLSLSGLFGSIFKNPKNYKRRIVSKGALQFFPRLFVGKVVQATKQELVKRDGLGMFPNTPCLYYSSAYIYFYATDYLLEKGHDYEDPHQIMKSMRETHFHDCSGFVMVEQSSNNWAAAETVITNAQYKSEADTMELKEWLL